MIKKNIFLIIFLGILFHSFAQKDYSKDADNAFKNEAYFQAVDLYKNAYVKEKSRAKKAEYLFKIAECFKQLQDFKQAEVWYKKSIKAGYPEPKAILYLAQSIKAQGRYDEALAKFKEYLEKNPADSYAEKEVKSCELAQMWVENPTRYEVAPEVLLNSEEFDFSPAWADKKYREIYFTSTREGSTGDEIDQRLGQNFSDIYQSKRDKKGKWSEPVPIVGENLNTPANEGSPFLDKKIKTLYFTRCEVVDKKAKYGGCRIFVSQKTGNTWGEPQLIPLLPDSAPYSVGHPALTPDEHTLIFSSDMKGGYGGRDLWYSVYDENEKKWGEPVNLGAEINTSGDEMFPFVHEDGTLYFASNGHLGMGALDIFRAEKKGDNQWGNVMNMKYPINSPLNDYGIIFEGTKERGYFTSDREGGRGKDDIWSFVLPPLTFVLQGTVKDIDTKQVIPGADVKLIGTDGSSVKIQTDENGFFKFDTNGKERYIKPNTSYTIIVSKDGYLVAKGKETTVGIEESRIFEHEYELQSIKKEEIKFPTVLYEYDKWELTQQGKDSLEYLYQVLIDNPNIVIELAAHTDSRGSDKYNLNLSQKRAESCVNYLISKGIDPERLKPKGYGETKLLISDEEIAKLPTEEEKEAAHQKNRRTVFKVLRDDYVPKKQNEDNNSKENKTEQ